MALCARNAARGVQLVLRTQRRCMSEVVENSNVQKLVKELEGNPAVMQEFVLSLGANARRSIAIKATAAEEAVLSSAEGRAAARRQLGAAVSSADIDNDGIVTRHEFNKWLSKQAEAVAGGAVAAAATDAPPTSRQLGLLGLNVAIPMIGFGFMDNFIMILAGDAIDASIGTRLGISMMASAALGNLCSDVLGLGLGDVVEATAKKFGLPAPAMTAAQLSMKKTKVIGLLSSSLGISIGCILGMVPLLFLEDDWTKEMREVFARLDTDGNGELVSSELEPMFRQLGVPDPVTAAAQVCAAHGEDKDTITLDEFLTATSTVGFKMK